jgi:glycosyltransferase involved in cell wall biosynthesis
VHNHYQTPGGESGVFDNLLRILQRVGQEVEVYCRHSSDITAFSRKSKVQLIWDAFFSWRSWHEIKAIVRKTSPNVAIVQNVFPLISPSVYYALQSEGVPIIQAVYNYRFVCPDAHLFSLGEICERCVLGNHWHAVRRKCYQQSYIMSSWYAAILKIHRMAKTFARNIDIFMIPDHFLGTRLIQGGIPAHKIRKNVNPFFVEDYQPCYQPGEYMLYVGRLVRQKGILTLVAAMAKASPKSPPLYIVGDGEARQEVERLINQLGLEHRVKLLGVRWGAEVGQLIGESRFVVVPSEWYDNLPLIVCQAYAMAKPVVASAINGIPEYVEHAVDGLLFQPGNAEDLAQCIDQINADPQLQARLAVNARCKAERMLDYQGYWTTLDSIIRELI